MIDPWFLPACELARALRERRVGAAELTRALLERIGGPGRALNAVVTVDERRALADADAADAALAEGGDAGPLCGVPITIKDSFDVEGLRSTAGWHRLADRIARTDAAVVRRLREAGAVVVGKTNVPPLAGDWQTDNPLFGPTLNPWNEGVTPGGSSGGSAAAVCAGLSFLDVGSDLGGSLRVPAAFCGVVTLKPTEWRVPGSGHVPDDGIPGTGGLTGFLRHMGVYGPLARSVADLGLAMSVLTGPDGRAPTLPPVPWRRAPARGPDSIRLGLAASLPGIPLGRESAAILARFAETLASAGVDVDLVDATGLDVASAQAGWGVIAGVEAAAVGSPLARGRDLAEQLELAGDSPMERSFLEGLLGRIDPYLAALAARSGFIRAVDALIGPRDALLVPVTAGPAFPPCPGGAPLDVDGREVRYVDYVAGHVVPFSYSGHPAIVLPAGPSGTGLPVGVQLVGRRFGDEALTAVAASLEEVAGPWPRPPSTDARHSPA